MSRPYPGGHNPSLDDGFTVVEPATYADDFVCTCNTCGEVLRLRPVAPGPRGPRWSSIEIVWSHRNSHGAKR